MTNKSLRVVRFFSSYWFILLAIVLLIVAPFARSVFEGNNTGGVPCTINFRISLWGGWTEIGKNHGGYYGFDFTRTGFYNDISSSCFAIAAVVLVSLALLPLMIGSISVRNKVNVAQLKLSPEQVEQRERTIQFVGSICSIVVGVLGILCLIFFGVFKSTVTQPYAWALPYAPPIRFAFTFYFMLLLFIFYFVVGCCTLTYRLKTGRLVDFGQLITTEETKEIVNPLQDGNTEYESTSSLIGKDGTPKQLPKEDIVD